MNSPNRNKLVVFVLILSIFILACGGGTATLAVTSTPAVTATAASTNTPLPPPTDTAEPTATEFPTPAPKGESINAGDYAFTVIDAVALRRIYPGGQYSFTPNPGYLIADIGVLVQNNDPSQQLSIPWENVYITEQSGDSWYPLWGTAKEVSTGTEVDPFTLGISDKEIEGSDTITFKEDVYLRLIFIVDDNNNNPVPLVFGIGASPEAQFVIEQPK